MNENCGLKIKPTARHDNKALMSIFKMAVPLIQLIQGGTEQSQTSRILAPVVSDLMNMYDFLCPADSLIQVSIDESLYMSVYYCIISILLVIAKYKYILKN